MYTLGLEFRSATGLEVVVLGINLFGVVVQVRTGAFWAVVMMTGTGVPATAVAAVSVFAVAVAAVERVAVVQLLKHLGEMAWRCFVSPPFSRVFLPPPGRSFLICAIFCPRRIRQRIRPYPPSSVSLAGSFVCLLFLW